MFKSFTHVLMLVLVCPLLSLSQNTVPVSQANTKAILPALPDSLYVIADTIFRKGGTDRWLLGDHYRKEWLTPVKVPVVFLDTLLGGVSVSREGGGKQTRALRLSIDSATKREIVIRTIEKFPDKAIPQEFTGGAISYFLKDQISTAHPFGALIIPPLAEAAQVYHTNPKIVFIPFSPKLLGYDSLYGNRLYLVEERARSDWSTMSVFGGSRQVISTEKLLEKVLNHSNNKVDAATFLRARLLDILIGDWDRHEEQWDWAAFSLNDETLYRPIPKDRDQAFVQLDGVGPWIGTRKWLLRRIQHFDYTISDVNGLTWQARHLDRFLLNGLSWQAWEKEILFVQSVWTDATIREAVAKLPPEHYSISGSEIQKKLVQRRLDLHQYARKFYLSLANKVDWTGTKDRDAFVVDLQTDSLILVQQYRLKKDTTLLIKQRSFIPTETGEMQFYGMEDDDIFEIKGIGRPKLKIRWIGGKGEDSYINNQSSEKQLRVEIYDTTTTKKYQSQTLKFRMHFDSATHTYRYGAFDYNRLSPLFLPGYNVDDGILIGGGLKWQKAAWGHAGFAQEQIVGVSYAFRTGAYEFSYSGLFKKAIRKWDAFIKSAVRHPAYILNFYGLGNNSERRITSRNFYHVRVRQVQAIIGLKQTFQQRHTVQLATEILSGKVESNEARFVKSTNPLFDSADFKRTTWLGLTGTYLFKTRNNAVFPTNGVRWETFARYNRMAGNNRWYLYSRSELDVYVPVGSLVLAGRLGGATVSGEPQFFQYAHLGGLENLRGYRRTRFSGKTAVYYNQEIRLPLKDIKGYVLRGKAGLTAFSDQGRVWYPGERSTRWHWGYGAGFWFIPYGRYAFTLTYAQSKEDRLVVIRSGFLF
jgi:hypothetical protein